MGYRGIRREQHHAHLTCFPALFDLVLDAVLALLHGTAEDVFALLPAHFGQLAVEERLGFGKFDLEYCNEQVHLHGKHTKSRVACCQIKNQKCKVQPHIHDLGGKWSMHWL